MVQAGKRLDMRRFGSVGNKQQEIAYNISGWTVAASRNRVIQSCRSRSTPCSVTTSTLQNATCICLMFLQGRGKWEMRSLRTRANKLFGRVGGLLGVGHSKSLS